MTEFDRQTSIFTASPKVDSPVVVIVVVVVVVVVAVVVVVVVVVGSVLWPTVIRPSL